jgi:hypothetical protein
MNELPLFFSSDPKLGAVQRPTIDNRILGNNFDVRLPRPIQLQNATNITLELSAINIWNSIPNISDFKNNDKLQFRYDAKNIGQPIVIPKGSYVVDTLTTVIQREMQSQPELKLHSNSIEFVGEFAQNKVVMKFNDDKLGVDFTVSELYKTLGFEKKTYDASDGSYFVGVNTPRFNVVTSFLLHTDFVSDGIINNNISGLVIGKIPLIADPGHLISYERINPFKVAANNLQTSGKQNINFKLTNEANEDIDMDGEYFDFALVLRWDSDAPFFQGSQSVVRSRV